MNHFELKRDSAARFPCSICKHKYDSFELCKGCKAFDLTKVDTEEMMKELEFAINEGVD